MSRLLRSELIKLRTTRTFYALAGVAVAISVLITVAVALLTDPTPRTVLADVFTNDTSSLFITILAIVGITGEWRHRTITSALLAAPDRLRFLAAKTLAFAAAGALLSVAISVTTAVVGLTILELRELPTPAIGELVEQTARNAVVAGLLGAFGVGVGAVVRNQAIAVVAILMLGFVVEPLLTALAPEVGRFGPTGALPISIQDIDPEQVGLGELDVLAPPLAVAAMLAWIAAGFAAGAALLRSRDVE